MNNEGWEFEAMFVGRFQPFHNGHFKAVKGILNECKNVLIVVGSSAESGTEKNPYSYEKRKQIIEQLFGDRVFVVDLPDINDDSKWVQYLVDTVPKFKVVYTGSEDTRSLFEKDGRYEVRKVDFLDGLSATIVREKLKLGENVQNLLPYEVAKIL